MTIKAVKNFRMKIARVDRIEGARVTRYQERSAAPIEV
jgi:hypothetical protein